MALTDVYVDARKSQRARELEKENAKLQVKVRRLTDALKTIRAGVSHDGENDREISPWVQAMICATINSVLERKDE
jgi:hypothetical protein